MSITAARHSAGAALALAVLTTPLAALPFQVPTAPPRATIASDSLPQTRRQSGGRPATAAALRPVVDTGAAAGPSLAGLTWRSIGPATMSGRIADVAIHPKTPRTWFVAAASGGVWKTTNAGTTFTPVFDAQSTYSIGAITIDPVNPNVLWVGTGENNYQRAVGYGDGVFKSVDGGTTWSNVGLKASEHIGRIVIDPTDPDVVYVAAQGPAWRGGGERGLYRTGDGGRTWTRILGGGEWVGVNDAQLDPRNPKILLATTQVRQRRVWGQVSGGPESAIHRSTDGGTTWTKVTGGLPTEEMGRIGLAISPKDPDVVYAVIEGGGERGGVYRSTDIGASWSRMGGASTSGLYYGEITADPHTVDRVYLVDTYNLVSDDAGRTFRRLGEQYKHVDNHVIWVDPADANHYLVGSDGGLYESFDRAATWKFFPNLPLAQFYKVAVDNSEPFYRVYGGTQDNATFGGPSRNNTLHGVANSEWQMVVFGDGFSVQVDPTDPNTVYGEWQNGGLVRHDRRTGENTGIQPQVSPGEAPNRWYWDSPLLLSPHNPKRIYYGSQRLWRSDDRGESWVMKSGDLTRNIDRSQLRLLGRQQSVDAVARNSSTSFFGSIITISESPVMEGLLYVGTDDGVVQVSEDGGANWRRVTSFPGVPDTTYVIQVVASRHDANLVYAVFNNHRSGDFTPYLLASPDRGRTWRSIAATLPARGAVYTVAEDPVVQGLLYAGTETGAHVSLDGGARWRVLKGGLPTIQVRHLVVQEREGDLVAATFGRGFYVLDDLTPLRVAARETAALSAMAEGGARLLPVRKTPMFLPAEPYMGGKGPGFFGAQHYVAANPPHGAVFTYWLPKELRSRRAVRQEREKALVKAGKDVPFPGFDVLRTEDREEAPAALLTVRDASGAVVRRLTGPVKAGFARVAWDLRHAAPQLAPPRAPDSDAEDPEGPVAAPGTYTVSLALRQDGVLREIGSETFEAEPPAALAGTTSRDAATREFRQETARLQRAVLGAVALVAETQQRLQQLRRAIDAAPSDTRALATTVRTLEQRLAELRIPLSGDQAISRRNEPVPASIAARVGQVIQYHWSGSGAPTATQRQNLRWAGEAFAPVRAALEQLVERDLRALETSAEAAGAPWTPGRVPRWP
ncbi:MAG: hypothetical protein IT355_05125 [Gemmatimonadaceae bacterium]|nr:hypothetical protein [Gemmatimonadaceae bacterium]